MHSQTQLAAFTHLRVYTHIHTYSRTGNAMMDDGLIVHLDKGNVTGQQRFKNEHLFYRFVEKSPENKSVEKLPETITPEHKENGKPQQSSSNNSTSLPSATTSPDSSTNSNFTSSSSSSSSSSDWPEARDGID